MTPLVKQFYSLVPNAHQSHWFDVGDLQGHAVELDAQTLVYLPFPDITLVGTDKGRPFALHALASHHTQHSDHPVVAVTGFALAPQFTALPILSYSCSETGDLQFWRKDKKGFDDVAQGMLGTLQHLLLSLNLGPRTAYLPTPIQSFTNQRKIAQGKKPSVTWNTITVQSAPPRATDTKTPGHEPRTTARAHTRRGHWRTLRSGKKVWVRNCFVGSARQGIALHDYKIPQKPSTSPNCS